MIKKILWGLLIFILLVMIGGYAYYQLAIYEPPLISEEDRTELQMMPLPAGMEFTGESFEITQDFGVFVDGPASEKLERAINRFKSRLPEITGIVFTESSSNGLNIVVEKEGKAIPTGSEDESYQLSISESGIVLTAPTDYGVIHGLQTILQLVDGQSIPTLELQDEPRFSWRGIMIDVSRHWIPKEVILRNLDAMAAVKMNVLHLHLSDDQGFRVESKTFPKLHEAGSNGKYYTQEEVKEIIQYAADRGIRIVPEFDIPGHTKSWLIAYPDYASIEKSFQFGRQPGDEMFTVPLDPTNEATYEFLDVFLGEMAELFPDPYLHIGGDEVNPKYWEESSRIQSFMEENNLETTHELQLYFNNRVNEILANHGKKMMGWEEILDEGLPENVVVQSWKNQKSLFEAVHAGYYGVLSAGLYLDHKLHTDEHYRVDPLVLPGAVEIEPDTTNWKMYDVVMDVPGSQMEIQLVLFDENPNDLSGFIAFADARTAFTGGTLQNDHLNFEFEASGAGELTFDAELPGDSLTGSVSLGVLSFDANGRLTGGDEMPGTEMPEIEVIEPLTDKEKTRVLGAEAAMWSEVVSDETIDSRIWPRSASIAEKLWSPQRLTNNTDDMYRRLEVVSSYLDELGLQHKAYQDPLLEEIGGEAYEPLKKIVSILEEAKYYNRHRFLMEDTELYLPELKLKTVADAALPESREARKFNNLVASYYENPSDEKKQQILQTLQTWTVLHAELEPYFETYKKLRDIEEISQQLSEISQKAARKLNGDTELFNSEENEETLQFLERGDHGVVVAVVPGLRQILSE